MSEIFFTKFINYLDTIAPLTVLLWPKSRKVLRGLYVYYFILVQFICNGLANILNELDWNNLYLYHINCILSFLALSFFFREILRPGITDKLIPAVFLLFALFFFYNIYRWEKVTAFNSNTFGVTSFILCGYSLYYYLRLLKKPLVDNISRSGIFWIVTGIFSYYTITFFIFLTYNKLTQAKTSQLRIIWQIHNVVFLIMFIYFIIGIRCLRLQKK